MAKTKKKTYSQAASKDPRTKGRSFKADSVPLAELNAGDTVVGTLQGRKQVSVINKYTKEPNDVWFYIFTDESGNKFAVSGRAMLDNAFEDASQALGGFEKLVGEDIRINRGDDEKTGQGFNLGTYEIIVLE
jgi:hypothetical protein